MQTMGQPDTLGTDGFIHSEHVNNSSCSSSNKRKRSDSEQLEETASVIIVPPGIPMLKLTTKGKEIGTEGQKITQKIARAIPEPTSTRCVMGTETKSQGSTDALVMECTLTGKEDEPLDLSLPRRSARLTEPGCEEPPPLELLDTDFITLDAYPPIAAPDQLNLEEGEIEPAWEEVEDGATSSLDCDTSDAPWEVDRRMEELLGKPKPGDPRPLQVIKEIKREGITLAPPPDWMLKRRGYSGHILHDGMLEQWSTKDVKFGITQKGEMSISRWVRVLESGEIIFRGHLVVVCLKALAEFETDGQIKNAIAKLSKAIRAAAGVGTRIFICDKLIYPDRKVLGIRATRYNQMLFEALRSVRVTHKLSKVHFVGMSKYFTDDTVLGSNKVKEHLTPEGRLTPLGCIHYRAHLIRELGLAPYN